ncbi:ChrR family anti-sigma-E factor [uncultured Maritalea sp.]|jgi:putative transcriptional regulator|uniref:ChrR family anti-sigma-E factor n=1 Tax=uncultured Maritalea sp. TaxID=757249 RepID=UPI0026282A4C|nr:ChrR family anti-sigma-E factor [uncultured Maritalea sp.]
MKLTHHLDDATLVRYAAGDLDEAFTVIVASHIAMCPQCQKASHNAEELGGQLLEAAEEVAVEQDAFAKLMGAIDDQNKANFDGVDAQNVHPFPKRRAKIAGDVPLPLQRFLGTQVADIEWKKVAPGISKHDIVLDKDVPSSLYLLNIAEGQAVPEHGHGGMEMTLILSGAYNDRFGRFGPGDIADLDEHVEHQPIVEPGGGPCICLVATEKPTKFKGIIERLLQPIIGI